MRRGWRTIARSVTPCRRWPVRGRREIYPSRTGPRRRRYARGLAMSVLAILTPSVMIPPMVVPPVMISPVLVPPVTLPAVIAASPLVHHGRAAFIHYPRGVVAKIVIVAPTVVVSTVVGAAIVAAAAVVPMVVFRIVARLGHQRAH